MDRRKQSQIMRVMGCRHEMDRQPDKHPLEALMDRVDPYEDQREETEMDVWEGNAPLATVQLEDDSFDVRTTTTARTPRGDEKHALNGKVIRTELIPRHG